MLDRLRPTERLILLALKLTPNQTADQIGATVGIRKRCHVMDAIRVLRTAGLLTQDTPTTYNLAAAQQPQQ